MAHEGDCDTCELKLEGFRESNVIHGEGMRMRGDDRTLVRCDEDVDDCTDGGFIGMELLSITGRLRGRPLLRFAGTWIVELFCVCAVAPSPAALVLFQSAIASDVTSLSGLHSRSCSPKGKPVSSLTPSQSTRYSRRFPVFLSAMIALIAHH